jgi:hypothetical protein
MDVGGVLSPNDGRGTDSIVLRSIVPKAEAMTAAVPQSLAAASDCCWQWLHIMWISIISPIIRSVRLLVPVGSYATCKLRYMVRDVRGAHIVHGYMGAQVARAEEALTNGISWRWHYGDGWTEYLHSYQSNLVEASVHTR